MNSSKPVTGAITPPNARQVRPNHQTQPQDRRKGEPSDRLMGSAVVVALRNGKLLRGQYVNSGRYEIELLTDTGRVVVFKHAIDWMHMAG